MNNICRFIFIILLFSFPSLSVASEESDSSFAQLNDLDMSLLRALESSQYDEVISLGMNCQVAYQVRTNGMRRHAYPFDWVIIPFESLMTFLSEKGSEFLNQDKIALIDLPPGSHHFRALDLKYGIHLVHDFKAPVFLSDYAEVKVKYDRRIKRFFDTLQLSNKRFLFVRLNITREQAEFLDHFLHTHYPKLSYTLLVLNDHPSFKGDWGLPRIRNFYLAQIPNCWQGDHARWKEILSCFHVKPATNPLPQDEYWALPLAQ